MRSCLLILLLLLPLFTIAQSQFSKPRKADQSKFRGEVVRPRAKPGVPVKGAWNATDPTTWNAGQRQKADSLWEHDRQQRLSQEAAARELQAQREPTAWERAYAEEQAKQIKDRETFLAQQEQLRAERKKRHQRALKNVQR
jgi:hypothetical protein